MDPRYVEVARKWVDEERGSVLFLSLENVPEDLEKRIIRVDHRNVVDVTVLIGCGGSVYFHDPHCFLDPAIVDKLLCL